MNQKQVAATILEQLGSGRFIAMIGAKNLMYDSSEQFGSLSFRIGKNASKFNHVRVALNGNDLYDVTFTQIRKYDIVKKETINDVYADMLREVFEEKTGMYVSL